MDFADTANGITRDSLAYFHHHVRELGPIIAADVFDPGDGWPCRYHLMLYDEVGNRMSLSGCAGGTYCEPARGTAHVLIESGFDPGQVRRVLAEAPLYLTRSAPPYSRDAAAEQPCVPSFRRTAGLRWDADRSVRTSLAAARSFDGYRVSPGFRQLVQRPLRDG
jgi:hypothetical protein